MNGTAEITMKLDNAFISIVMQVLPLGVEPEEQKNTEKSLLLCRLNFKEMCL
jgi:hypothetical protein